MRFGQSQSDRIERQGGAGRLRSDVLGAMAPLQFMRFLQASLDQPECGRPDVSDMSVGDQTSKHQLDLRSLVWVIAKLGVVEKRVEDSKICMSKLQVSTVHIQSR